MLTRLSQFLTYDLYAPHMLSYFRLFDDLLTLFVALYSPVNEFGT